VPDHPLSSPWIDRSRADLALLTSKLDAGPSRYAGIPRFCTPFGRDAVINALQALWLDPRMARGVLSFLAAQEGVPFLDAAPGTIVHETRKGEMSATSELPFGHRPASAAPAARRARGGAAAPADRYR
jgi:glycogen debranching enzyme